MLIYDRWSRGQDRLSCDLPNLNWNRGRECEGRHVAAARQQDPNGVFRPGTLIVFLQPRTKAASLYSDDRVQAGIKFLTSIEHLDAESVFL
jgi:hypothetical protein